MYSMFALSGLVDLLSLLIHYPVHTQQIFLALACFVTSFMMHFHKNSEQLEMVVYHLFQYSVSTTTIFAGLRILSPVNLVINTGFSLSLILQGSWMVQTAYVLYGPTHWRETYSGNLEMMVPTFVWHIVTVMVSGLVIYTGLMAIARLRYGRIYYNDPECNRLLKEEEKTNLADVL